MLNVRSKRLISELHLFSNRKGEGTGYFPSMFLQKASKRAQSEAAGNNLQGQKPPPRRFDRLNNLIILIFKVFFFLTCHFGFVDVGKLKSKFALSFWSKINYPKCQKHPQQVPPAAQPGRLPQEQQTLSAAEGWQTEQTLQGCCKITFTGEKEPRLLKKIHQHTLFLYSVYKWEAVDHFVTNRQHSRRVWHHFWEWAKEGGSSHPSAAQHWAHPTALQRQDPQKNQHPQVKLCFRQQPWTSLIFYRFPHLKIWKCRSSSL